MESEHFKLTSHVRVIQILIHKAFDSRLDVNRSLEGKKVFQWVLRNQQLHVTGRYWLRELLRNEGVLTVEQKTEVLSLMVHAHEHRVNVSLSSLEFVR